MELLNVSEPTQEAALLTEGGHGDVVTAILDHGAFFSGKLTFEGTAQIGGQFEGEIFTTGTLIINSGAFVQAEVEADTVIINGRFEGNLFA